MHVLLPMRWAWPISHAGSAASIACHASESTRSLSKRGQGLCSLLT